MPLAVPTAARIEKSVERQQRHDERGAADAHERRDDADAHRRDLGPRTRRQMIAEPPVLATERHLERNDTGGNRPDPLERLTARVLCHQHADHDAHDHEGRDAPQQARSTAPLARCPANDLSAVGRITASVVPSARCILIAGSTPSTPKISYSTGTRTPPPPMPSNPARKPAMSPAATSAAASAASSPPMLPRAPCPSPIRRRRQGARGLGETQRLLQHADAGLVLDRAFAQVTTKRACMRAPVIEAEDVPRDVVEPTARLEMARDVGIRAPRSRRRARSAASSRRRSADRPRQGCRASDRRRGPASRRRRARDALRPASRSPMPPLSTMVSSGHVSFSR